jgi:hypothetical protein
MPQKKTKSRAGISAARYLKKHPQPVILAFQPTHFVPMRTPEELATWERMVRDLVGLEGLNADDSDVSYTGTKCGTPGGIDPFDDCESD